MFQYKIIELIKVLWFTRSNLLYINFPRLTIEKFNNDTSDWQRFCDQLDSPLRQNSQNSNFDIFHYLRSYLTTLVTDAINEFSLTNTL